MKFSAIGCNSSTNFTASPILCVGRRPVHHVALRRHCSHDPPSSFLRHGASPNIAHSIERTFAESRNRYVLARKNADGLVRRSQKEANCISEQKQGRSNSFERPYRVGVSAIARFDEERWHGGT